MDIHALPWDTLLTHPQVPHPILGHLAVGKAPLTDVQRLHDNSLAVTGQSLLANDLLGVPARVPALEHDIAKHHIVYVALERLLAVDPLWWQAVGVDPVAGGEVGGGQGAPTCAEVGVEGRHLRHVGGGEEL